jgi:hypothetical protein
MTTNQQPPERRQHARIRKHYIVRVYQKENPALKQEACQIENISRGGLCFSSTAPFLVGTQIALELRTPYVAEKVYIEGLVLESKEKIKGVVYQNRIKFTELSPYAAEVLDKVEKYNLSKEEKT